MIKIQPNASLETIQAIIDTYNQAAPAGTWLVFDAEGAHIAKPDTVFGVIGARADGRGGAPLTQIVDLYVPLPANFFNHEDIAGQCPMCDKSLGDAEIIVDDDTRSNGGVLYCCPVCNWEGRRDELSSEPESSKSQEWRRCQVCGGLHDGLGVVCAACSHEAAQTGADQL